MGIVAGPGGPILGAVAGAMLAALAGAAAGCTVGAALGEFLDDNVLNNHLCLDCGHSFTQASPHAKDSQAPRAPAHPYGPEPFPTDSDWEDGEEGGFPHRAPRD